MHEKERYTIRPYKAIRRCTLTTFDRLKPWPDGLASSRKFKTWVYLRLRLARPCMHLR